MSKYDSVPQTSARDRDGEAKKGNKVQPMKQDFEFENDLDQVLKETGGKKKSPQKDISYDQRSDRSAKNNILGSSMKDSSFASSVGSESGKSNISDNMPKMRVLDRSKLMDMMLFPQNCKKMVIVPSNKEGTGFLNHCYDKTFLHGVITEKEFNAIVLICSRIAARAYS